jgi:hypothetical protein
MRYYDLDQTVFASKIMTALAIRPVVDQDGVQRRDRDGVPKWRLELAMNGERGTEVERINFATDDPPDVVPGVPIELPGLRLMPWENIGENGKNAGVSLSAQTVRFVTSGRRSPGPETPEAAA